MNLDNIRGLGPKKIDILNKKGINSLNDLILFYPVNYIIYGELITDERFLIECSLNKKIFNKNIKGKTISFFSIKYNEKIYNCSSFALKYSAKNFKVNDILYLYGRYDYPTKTIIVERLEKDSLGYIIPIYPKMDSFSDKTINKFINIALTHSKIKNYKANFIMHNPKNIEQLSKAMFNLKVEEYLEYRQMIDDLVLKQQSGINNFNFLSQDEIYARLKDCNIKLNEAQVSASKDLYEKFITNKFQDILLFGEVGSGKSYIMLFCILCNLINDQQILIVLPTKILAQQFFDFIQRVIPDCVLINELSNDTIVHDIKIGVIKVVVATHGIANEKYSFKNLVLIIFDEQQRYGVKLKQQVKLKNKSANVIEVSATPIPRTLSQFYYGLKTIVKLAGQNNHINSHIVRIAEIYDIIDTTLSQGKQLLIICPAIDNDLTDIWSVNKINQTIGKGYKTGLIHSKLEKKTIDSRINAFKKGSLQLLIATSILEVGVNFEQLSNIIILNADYFGMAQLHQFRGRVGRLGQSSNCYFHYDGSNEKTIQRLNYLIENNEGEAIAVFDMQNRGYGNVIGIEQSGNMDFKIFNPAYDNDVIDYVIEYIIK